MKYDKQVDHFKVTGASHIAPDLSWASFSGKDFAAILDQDQKRIVDTLIKLL